MRANILTFILCFFASMAIAVPGTGTVYQVVQTDTNSVLVGSSTNLAAANGIATIGQLSVVSNLSVSGIASAAVAKASADAAMSTGAAAQVSASSAITSNSVLDHRVTAIETNHATAAQGAMADTAWTNSLDSLRQYHYGSKDVIESPASWFQTDGNGTITNFLYQAGRENVVIPWQINGIATVAVGSNAFYGSYTVDMANGNGYPVTNVVCPRTVTSIGNYAFILCKALRNIVMPAVDTVGVYSLAGCLSFTNVSFPSIKYASDNAFNSCTNMVSIFLDGVVSVCSNGPFGLFYGCPLTNAYMPKLEYLGPGSFYQTKTLQNIDLPSVKTINSAAFYYCYGLQSVSIPSATWIGHLAFTHCTNLTSITFAGNAPVTSGNVYTASTLITNYVTNPTATGWGSTFGGQPVVRLPLYGSGSTLTDITPPQIGAAWYTNQVLGIDGSTNTLIYLGAP